MRVFYQKIVRYYSSLSRTKKIAALSTIGVLLVSICAGGWVLLGEEKTVTVDIDGTTQTYTTYTHNVAELLNSENIILDSRDKVEPALDAKLEDGGVVKVRRYAGVDILADGDIYYLPVYSITVAEALEQVGIRLDSDDTVTPAGDTPLSKDMVIEVQRIEVKEETREIPVAYCIEKIYDSTLAEGEEKVKTPGVQGKQVDTYRVTYSNDKIIREELLDSLVTEAVNEVILVGSKDESSEAQAIAAAASLAPNGMEYTEEMTMTATAYTHTGSKTKMGTECRVGIIAVDPSVIPLGTRLYVENYGYCTAEDTGGKIKGNRIDIFLDTEQECVDWGVRTVKVYILK